MLITFEGIDGSGKTTQVKLLRDWLIKRGFRVLVTEEPTKGLIGKVLEKFMRDKEANKKVEALLFAADRAEHTDKVIKPNLDKIVICDRYTHSSIAYQTSIGLSRDWVKCLNKNNLEPDLTIYLDVKPEVALKRIGKRSLKTIKYEKLEMLSKVRIEYLRMKSKKFKAVNGEKSVKEVHEDIKRLLNDIN